MEAQENNATLSESRKKSRRRINDLKYTPHARERQEQRNITDDSVNEAIKKGVKDVGQSSKKITDENIAVVLGKKNEVVTVMKNMRNLNFLISERTTEKEASLIHKVNEKNDVNAMCELAELYMTGELGEKDVGKAFDLFEKAAKKGSSHAMCRLSALYESGDLGEPNLELANKWMKKAAQKKNNYALSIIGQKLLAEYVEKYPVESTIQRPNAPIKEIYGYLHKAAKKGATRALWTLAHIYEEGLLGEKNLTKAIDLYVKAAKMGSPSSLQSLHMLTTKGQFNPKEFEEIFDSVSFRVTKASIGMALQLGVEQLNGDLGYNPVRGLKMIEKVALKQYDDAIVNLARCYRGGIRCKPNLKLTQYWFNKLRDLYDKSAKEGNVNSLRKLAKLYLKGKIGNIDLEKAEYYFKEAVEKSANPQWLYELGMLYLKGRLGNKPLDVGIKLIASAIKIWVLQAESGNTNAFYDLGNAYFSIHEEKKGVHWLSNAPRVKGVYEASNIDVHLLLAKIYLNSPSQKENVSQGLQILENIILEHSVGPSTAFDAVEFPIKDETVLWLQNIADSITKPSEPKASSFEEFVLATLAEVYETGKLNGNRNYNGASKCYYQLFEHLKNHKAGNKLVLLYSNQHLPAEYHCTVDDWVSVIPALLETNDVGWYDFLDCISLLGKIYQKGILVPYNTKEATKWLLVLQFFTCDSDELKRIEDDLKNLPPLDFNQKAQIISELTEMTKRMKITSMKYKPMTRMLGDIFYDGKITDKNIDKAIFWYTESVGVHNTRASFTLGKIYQHDLKDIDTAIGWYKSSAQLGYENAIKVLTELADERQDSNLSSFLHNYVFDSSVKESNLKKIKPFRNLEVYPKTVDEMYELGKSYLNSGNEDDLLNAAFWLRKAMKGGSIVAAMELHSMYDSGSLGVNLVPCAGNLYPDILKLCYTKLTKSTAVQNVDVSEILLSLNNVLSVLMRSYVTSACTLSQKIVNFVADQTSNGINTKHFAEIILDLKQVMYEQYSRSTVSQDLDVYLLAEEVASKAEL